MAREHGVESEYLCLTIRSNPDESEAAFKTRISELWSRFVRTQPDLFEKIYAETTRFERSGNRLTRQYLVEAEAAEAVTTELTNAGMDFLPLDPDDLYSKYEATPPDWFWIEH